MTDRYAVVGNPVAHSRSPWIHAAFARQSGQDLSYGLQQAEIGQFAVHVDGLRQQGYRGLNVTVPFKLDAIAYARERGDQISARARMAGAANTLKFEDGRVWADNTDGIGLVQDITRRMGVSLRERRVMILGAGGATRGVVLPLIEAGVASLVIANRTLDKARGLAESFAGTGQVPVTARALSQVWLADCDVLINATSSGLSADGADLLARLPQQPSGPDAARPVLAYDMVYGAQPTAFMAWARGQGIGQVCDGLGMLVEQAAEAFQWWRGLRPDADAVFRDLRAQLQAAAPAS